MVTTTNTRRALSLMQTIVSLDRAITSDTAAEGRKLVEAARVELAAVDAALEDSAATTPMAEIRHVYAPSLGGVRVKFETNSRGTNVETSVDRPREAGESYEDAARHAAEVAATARRLANEAIEAPSMPISIVDGGRS